MWGNCDINFFQFMANLEQFRSRISNAQSVKQKFTITGTLNLQKTKTELKNLLHCSHAIALSKGTIFSKKS